MPGPRAQLVPADQFPFVGTSYLLPSPILDCQRSINLYPEAGTRGSKTVLGLTGRPGLATFGDPSSGGQTIGHSLYAGAGRLFAAIGTHVYEVKNDGTALTDYGTGLGATAYPTPMIANGTQLLICDPGQQKVFNVDPGGPVLTQVFSGIALEYLDGFYISIAVGASLAGSNPNQINASTNGDGTSWPGLSYVIRTGAADLTIQLAVLNGLLYIFGQKTIEVWYDAGNNVFPFARVANGQINIGCLAAASVVKFANTIMWLGSDQTGYGSVYMMQGMNPVKVSNPAIDFMISFLASSANALIYSKGKGYQEDGHIFYELSLCNSSYQTVARLVYDLTMGLWHERAYTTVNPTGFASVPNFGATIPNFVLDESSGKVFYQAITYPSDSAAVDIVYTRTAPHTGGQNQWYNYSRFTLDLDPQADGAAGTLAPILDWSNNGGKSFRSRNIAMAQTYDTDGAGESQRFFAMQTGRSRDRVFKVSITSHTDLVRIANAFLNARLLPGSESQ